MATININFDTKSIKQAIKQVQNIKKKLSSETIKVFLTKCLDWVKNRANEKLSNIQMDNRVIGDIQTNWNIEQVNQYKMRLVNTSDKAVYVEFGVGKVAEDSPHPKALDNNPPYEYNINSGKKDKDGTWRFTLDEERGIDLVGEFYDITIRKNGKRTVDTFGSPANLYLYNAAMDLISTGIYKEFWSMSLKQTI
ncbi:MAG: hypothetical protein ACI4PF_01110 [Christensenellales bacterium]